MSIRLALCLLLLCASMPAIARDMHLSAANGDGGGSCTDAAPPGDEAGPTHGTDKRPQAPKPAKGKPAAAATRGSDAGADIRPPRWHSFLPGMFR